MSNKDVSNDILQWLHRCEQGWLCCCGRTFPTRLILLVSHVNLKDPLLGLNITFWHVHLLILLIFKQGQMQRVCPVLKITLWYCLSLARKKYWQPPAVPLSLLVDTQNPTSPHCQVIALTWFSENSELEVEVIEIQTQPRFLVDTPMTSIWSSYVASFLSYLIHKVKCPSHDDNNPMRFLQLRGKNLHTKPQNQTFPEEINFNSHTIWFYLIYIQSSIFRGNWSRSTWQQVDEPPREIHPYLSS